MFSSRRIFAEPEANSSRKGGVEGVGELGERVGPGEAEGTGDAFCN